MGLLPYSLKGDVIAGVSVGVMLVPQSIAFALLAGLPVQLGLFSSFVPLLAYAFFGTVRQQQIGPTAVLCLLIGNALAASSYTSQNELIAASSLLSMIVGLTTIVMAVFRLGFVVDFIPNSVMDSWCTASALTIFTSQLPVNLGLKMPRTNYWWQTTGYILTHLHQSNVPTLLMGFGLLAFLLLLKAWKSAGSAEARAKHIVWRWFPKQTNCGAFPALKFVADFSSLIAVVLGWLWGLAYRKGNVKSVSFVGSISCTGFLFGLPGSGLPPAAWSDLAVAGIVIGVVGYLQSIAVGAKVAGQFRYSYDANQELVALGLANCVCGFMFGFPVSVGFSRTATNIIFGATSQIASVLSAMVVMLAVYLIMSVVETLPLAALSPLVMQGAMGLFDFQSFVTVWKGNRLEFLLMVITFVVSLVWTVQEGLYAAFAGTIAMLVYHVSLPNMAICGQMPDNSFRDIRYYPEAKLLKGCRVVRMDASLCFANSRRFKEFCLRASELPQAGAKVQFLIIDFKSINGIDLTGCDRLVELAATLHRHGQTLLVAAIKGPVMRSLHYAGVQERLKKHDSLLCWNMEQAIATANGTLTHEDADVAVLDLKERLLTFSSSRRKADPSPDSQATSI